MKISESEMTFLIVKSVDGKYVNYKFGLNFVELADDPCNDWAKELILKMRECNEIN